MEFTERDLKHLNEVHPHLRAVIEKTAEISEDTPFMVLDGARTVEEQRRNVAKGASKTMRSRHIPGPNGYSNAVDIAPLVDGEVSWDWEYYYPLAEAVKKASKEVGVNVEWGGDWKSFKDGPHWQLSWAEYPGYKDPTLLTMPERSIKKFSKKEFFDQIRDAIALTTENVEGFDKLLDMGYQRSTPINHLSYILATVYWETNKRMQPVKEAYWKSEAWRKKNLRYYPYYGRGLVQTTWEENYKKLGNIVGVDLVENPDLLLSWDYAAQAVFVAMETGLYTGKKLSDYIDDAEETDEEDYREYVEARRIINGTDKAKVIADLAVLFEAALYYSRYPVDHSNKPVEEFKEEKQPDLPESPKPSVQPSEQEFTLGELLAKLILKVFGKA